MGSGQNSSAAQGTRESRLRSRHHLFTHAGGQDFWSIFERTGPGAGTFRVIYNKQR